MKINLPKVGMSGHFTVLKGKDIDNMEQIASFPNLILDSGLRHFATNENFLNYANVGSSGVAVSASQTTLIARLYQTNTQAISDVVTANNEDPLNPYVQRVRSLRFPPNGVSYNVAEVGFGWDTSGSLFNRALVLDGVGTPTVISVQADEFLTVIYELRLYPPVTDTSGSFTPTGKDTTPRTWTARAGILGGSGVLVYNGANSNAKKGWGLDGKFAVPSIEQGAQGLFLFTGMGVLFGFGGYENAVQANKPTGSHVMDVTGAGATISLKALLSEANDVRGIKSIVVCTTCTCFQIEFSDKFFKTADDEIIFSFHLSWGRR